MVSINSRCVLLVEDEAVNRVLITRVLEKHGYSVISTTFGYQAIEVACSRNISAMIIDYQLPDMTGADIVVNLKNKGLYIPFIIITGQGDEFLAVEMMKLGASDYISKKPGFMQLLTGVLERVFQKLEVEEKLENAQNALQASESKLHSLFSVMHDVIVVLDSKGKYLEIAPTRPDLYYRPANELLGHTLSEVLPTDLAAEFMSLIKTVLETQSYQSIDYQMEISNTRYWFTARVIPYANDSVLWVARDITPRKLAEQELRESEMRYKLITTLSGHIVFEYDVTSEAFVWGGAIEEISGYSYYEYTAFGVTQWESIIHPDDREMVFNLFRKALESNTNFSYQYRIRHKLGHFIWLEMQSFPLPSINEPTHRIIGILKDITESKRHEQQMLSCIISTEERERTLFSQELHDGLGPVLSAIKMYVQLLNKPNAQLSNAEIVKDIESLLDEAFKTVRDVSFKLSPLILSNYGLGEAVKAYVNRIMKMAQIECSVNNTGFCNINEQVDTVVYRIICECVNNTVKHANANKVNIYINGDSFGLAVKYSDDGIGFDMQNGEGELNGVGLLNIVNRIKSLSGTYAINSSPGCGFCLELFIKNEDK